MNPRIAQYFLLTLLFCAMAVTVVIFLPFLKPMVIAAATAVLAHPLYVFFRRHVGGKNSRGNLAALFTVLVIMLVILVPLFLLIGRMYVEIQSMYTLLTDESQRSMMVESLNNLSVKISTVLFDSFPAYSFDSLDVTEYVKTAIEWLFSHLDNVFSGIATVAAYSFVFLLSTFYFLRDGEIIKKRFISFSPLLDAHDEHITKTFARAVRSVFAGTIVVGIIQGFLTGIGFFLFGIPAPVLWGSVAAVASLIPGLGTSLVIGPAVIYFIMVGQYTYAIGLAIWGALAVGLIDNLLGPYLVNRGVDIHPFLILISVLGGIATFGIVGFVLGPIIMAILFALVDIYRLMMHTAPHKD